MTHRSSLNELTVAEYAEALTEDNELTAFQDSPMAIAYITRDGGLFQIRIDWMHSISKTIHPIPSSRISTQLEALGFHLSSVILDDVIPKNPGCVYFLQQDKGDPIKIGKAQNIEKRFSDIQNMLPVRLRVLATIPGGFELEGQLHKRFAASRLHGEWFRPTPGLLALIQEHAQ